VYKGDTVSVILYHKGWLFADSASVISGATTNYPNLFNTNKVTKLNFSESGMSVFGSVGVLMSDSENTAIATMLENTIITEGSLEIYDKELEEFMMNVNTKTGCSIQLFFMTSVDMSSYYLSVHRTDENDKNFQFGVSRLGDDDVVVMGSGGLLAFTAINAGIDPMAAMKYAVRNDPNASGPIRYVSIKQLNRAAGV
jgi:hypothetical protein